MGHVTIFSGAFGSGKTEIALNYALERAGQSKYDKVLLADLDTANPYFVARDARDQLGAAGEKISIIAPVRELAQADVPNLPVEIIGLLRTDNEMVLDLAGDKFGALVLGYISGHIRARRNYDMYLVINPFRPFSANLDEVMELRNMLEGAGRLKFTGIISNPNLVEETTADLIKEGHRRVVGFAKALEIPVAYLAVEGKYFQELYPEYGNDLKCISLFLRPDWIRGLEEGMKDGEGQG
ncbi:hypothetical protein ASZ90_017821 [hydrocarbon metagenome]|uniref:CobQ/CobB/MinD/ParA nucleotide binding domain-containing protein n=1 Tax=hydrocarbon metagenome TaxID=938273 RepID=A0A0W8E7T3_9ZZZZ